MAIAFIIYYQIDQREMDQVIGVFLITVLFGTALSWLIFLLCYFLFHRLPRHGLAQLKRIKPIISGTAIVSMLLTCLMIGIDFSAPDPEWLIPRTLGTQKKLTRERDFYGGKVQLYENP